MDINIVKNYLVQEMNLDVYLKYYLDLSHSESALSISLINLVCLQNSYICLSRDTMDLQARHLNTKSDDSMIKLSNTIKN